jgi:ABC-type polar amino acid transport system ATPase subunit
MADTSFLELRGVEKRFGDNLVLNGVDLTVAEHELVSLIGASGCGKSTLLRCINALEPIQAGTISLQGEVVAGKGVDVDRHRREVGIMFQSFNLFPHMTVLQNITLAPRREASSRVCFLDQGVLREQGPPEQIFSEPADPRTRAFLKRIIEAGRL